MSYRHLHGHVYQDGLGRWSWEVVNLRTGQVIAWGEESSWAMAFSMGWEATTASRTFWSIARKKPKQLK